MLKQGEHRNIYHIGTTEEVPIAEVAREIGVLFGRRVNVIAGEPAKGGTTRRCPSIEKLKKLGYMPRYTLRGGLMPTAQWYAANADKAPA